VELPSWGGGLSIGPAEARSVGRLTIPKRANGIAVVVYGRLSVTTKSGFHIHGLPVAAASLSPQGRYVAVGKGQSIVELAPSGQALWSRAVGKPVANCGACNIVSAISWSPDESRIAYLVRTGGPKQVLHVVWRDGTHDSVIDSNAHGTQPAWRAGSGALAYIGAHGRPIIYDLAHMSRRVITWPIARGATHLAFAPRGGELAIATETAALLLRTRREVVFNGQTQYVNWIGDRLLVSERLAPSGRSKTQIYTVTRSGAMLRRTVRLPGPLWTVHGRTIALAGGNHVLAGPIGSLQSVFRFTVKPPYRGWCACGEIPMGKGDISLS
jgi:hypothetical protein